MKQFKNFLWLPMVFITLTGCNLWGINDNKADMIYIKEFSGKQKIVLFKAYIYTDKVTENTQVISAQVFVGTKWSQQRQDRNTNGGFTFYIQDTCKNLPQGSDQIIRYEMYDASGVVVQEDSVIVDIDSCN